LLSCGGIHGFLIATEFQTIGIKAGFSSGYGGEGPNGLAAALRILCRHRVDIEEYQVDVKFMERLAASALLRQDLDHIERAAPIRPQRWTDYIYDLKQDALDTTTGLSRHYDAVMPFQMIDDRIMDLAVGFWDNEDHSVISAFRRLEDVVRTRTDIAGEGVKLFSKAFLADEAPLSWNVPDKGEATGRANLFIAVYMAFRNGRVHRESSSSSNSLLREFLMANELFSLEREAQTVEEMEESREEARQLQKFLEA